MKKSPTVLTAIIIALILLISRSTSAQSVIRTDEQDYAPGDTVFITGSGFQAGETVMLAVLHEGDSGDNETSAAHAPWQTVADENGNLSSTWIVPIDEDEGGATLKLTADGQTSSLHAETIFTDATNSLSPRAGTIAGGTAVTITGSGYTAGAIFAVKFGDTTVPATRITSSTLTAIAPAHAAGAVNVTVVINGVDDVPLTNGYTYVCPNPSNVIFTESMGTVSTTTTIAAHEAADGFDNDGYTMSGTADVRSSSASADYPGASGNANIFLTTTIGTHFQIAGINTSGLSNLELSFGLLKSSTTADASDLVVEVSSDGVSYAPLSFPPLPAGTGTAGWYYRTTSGNIPSTANLRIRFRQIGTVSQYRLDDIRLTASPQITVQPANSIKCVGDAAIFSVAAAGTALNYQWYKGSVAPGNEVGANSSSYTINAVAVSDAATYYVLVSGSCSPPATSKAATLTVSTAPLVTANPNDESTCAGGLVSFTSAANSIPGPGSQWQVSSDGGLNYSDLPGETNTTLNLTASTSQNGYKYRVVFSNSCGSTTSNAATLTLNAAPSVTGNPTDESRCAGAPVSFIAAAAGSPVPNVQWQESSDGGITYNDLAGETGIPLALTTSASQNGNKYRAVFTNSCGSASTTAATLSITAPTAIVDQLINGSSTKYANIVYGCTLPTLSVTATGEGTLTYIWFRNSTNSNSAGSQVSMFSSSSYTLPAGISAGTYYFYVEVTGNCGITRSDVFTVIVSPQQANAANDGALYYTGPANAWTPTTTSNSATVTLSAFIKNSSEPGAACGDIATARITFETKNSTGLWTPIPGAQNLPVFYVDATDPAKGGTAAAISQLSISNNTATQIFDIRVVVSGNYVVDPAYSCSQITVSKLLPGGSISGGVVLCGHTPTGLLRPSATTPSLLGFGVEYAIKQNKIQNPKGKVNLYVASFYDLQGNSTFPDPNWYKISCNAIAGLAITNPTATFTSKANVAKYNPATGDLVAVEGNCTLVLDLKDNITTGYSNVQDLAGITVYRNAGGVWYSNNWCASKTVPAEICAGDLTVTGTTSASSTTTYSQRSLRRAEEMASQSYLVAAAYPNPAEHSFTLKIETDNLEVPVLIRLTDIAGREVYAARGAPGQNYEFGKNLARGVYIAEIIQGKTRSLLKLVKL